MVNIRLRGTVCTCGYYSARVIGTAQFSFLILTLDLRLALRADRYKTSSKSSLSASAFTSDCNIIANQLRLCGYVHQITTSKPQAIHQFDPPCTSVVSKFRHQLLSPHCTVIQHRVVEYQSSVESPHQTSNPDVRSPKLVSRFALLKVILFPRMRET